MKLRNKKTGEIREIKDILVDGMFRVNSLADLNEEWEDYEEQKNTEYYWYIGYKNEIRTARHHSLSRFADNQITTTRKEIGNYFETREEAERAVEKLKAWKRLKDKNFHFLKYSALGCGEIEFSLDFEDMDDEGEIGELQADLELLFGGEE